MYHGIWIISNALIIIGSIIYIWIFSPHDNTLIVISQFLAQIAMVLFVFNVNIYFIFLLIRKTKQREVKIRLATYSRYFMKWHIKIAITSTLLIIGHVCINLFKIGPVIGYGHLKMLMGYISFILYLSFSYFVCWVLTPQESIRVSEETSPSRSYDLYGFIFYTYVYCYVISYVLVVPSVVQH